MSRNLSLFLGFISSVAYLTKELGPVLDDCVTAIILNPPGAYRVNMNRTIPVGGMEVKEELEVELDNQIFVETRVGLEGDYSQLVVWGKSDPPSAFVYWQTEMETIKF